MSFKDAILKIVDTKPILSKDNKVLKKVRKNNIEDGTFKIPTSVQVINTEAFYNIDEIKTLEIPKNVNKIEVRGIHNCKNLKQIVFKSTSPLWNAKDNGAIITKCFNLSLIVLPSGEKLSVFNIKNHIGSPTTLVQTAHKIIFDKDINGRLIVGKSINLYDFFGNFYLSRGYDSVFPKKSSNYYSSSNEYEEEFSAPVSVRPTYIAYESTAKLYREKRFWEKDEDYTLDIPIVVGEGSSEEDAIKSLKDKLNTININMQLYLKNQKRL